MSLVPALRASRHTLPAFAVQGMYWGAFAALVPDIKAGLGASDGAFGVALLVSTCGAVMAMWLAPRTDAAFGRFAMPGTAAVFGITFLVPGWLSGLVPFALVMMAVGASSGLLDVIMNARVSHMEAHHRLALMNLNHAGFSLVYAAAAALTGLARDAGADAGLVLSALFPLALGLAALTVMPPMSERADGQGGRAWLAPVVLAAGLITLAGFMAENATETWSALFIERTLAGGVAQGALGPAILGLTMGIGRLAGQIVTRRGHETRTILAAALISAFGAVLVALAGSPPAAYLGFAALGFGISVIAPLALAIVGQRVAPEDRARAISHTAVIGYLGFFIGPPLMGFVAEAASLRASFALIALIMLMVPLALLGLRAR